MITALRCARNCASLLCALSCASPGPDPRAPETRRVDVVDTIHGVSIPDPYRWLEKGDDPETRAWIDAQNTYAERVVGESPRRQRIRARVQTLMRNPEIGRPRTGGEYEYFTLRRVEDEIPSIFRRKAPAPSQIAPIDPYGDFELVLDPAAMSSSSTTRVEILAVSPDGRYLIYGVRDGGRDEIEVRVRDVERAADLPEFLEAALYGGISFDRGSRGFYYTYRSRDHGPRVRFHELGTAVEKDPEIFGDGYGPTSFLVANEVADGKYLVFTVNHGWARSELHLKELNAPVREIVADVDARFYPQFHAGLLYVRTNLDAPNNRVLAIDLEKPARENWMEVIAEKPDVLTGFSFLNGKIYASYLHDVGARILVYELDGALSGPLELPEHVRAEIREGGPGTALLEIASFALPPVTYLLDLQTGEREVWERMDVEIDEDLVVEQVWYRSKDGVEVPMYLFHKSNLAKTGRQPTLLFGYGGFNVAQTPQFDPMALVWVEEGGVYAMANLRGGSEFGEAWHRAGMLANKQNVFDDFLAAAEFLIEEGYTRPERLAIRGVSNGGLLVASAATQRPDLFRAVLCGFPDLDMVRFYTFTDSNNMPALLEYGDASIREQFEFLKSYSPYQAVRDGTDYPAVMLTSGDLDTRVPPLQARKMTARLQAATRSGLPVILRYRSKAGHAANYGMPMSQSIEDVAMELEFLLTQLGVAAGS